MRDRVPGSRVRWWLLLGGNRNTVTMILVVGVFAAIVLAGAVAPAALRAGLAAGDPLETVFQALLTAIITGVTLVVSINQVVLSQELGAVGDQRERMAGAVTFREDVAEAADLPAAPPDPASFLQAIVDLTHHRAEAFGEAVEDAPESVADRVRTYVDSVTGNAAAVSDRLGDAQFGTFAALQAALDYNYSWKIYEGRRLRREHGDALDESAVTALDDLLDALQFFGPAREHVKTLYFQWELINLSRAMLYAAVPALVVTTSGVLYAQGLATIQGTVFGVESLVIVVAAMVTVAVWPFLVLGATVLRIATVAKRTLSIGPFILRETDRSEELEWEQGG
ncbi:MAG: hypothetical protein ABEJ57_08395 [Halobacteriaceae archaeon]